MLAGWGVTEVLSVLASEIRRFADQQAGNGRFVMATRLLTVARGGDWLWLDFARTKPYEPADHECVDLGGKPRPDGDEPTAILPNVE
jgi:hypothetical protein